MNYVLQVVRGRSASTTLKLADGVTSIGRHDDCVIRIKSSQVSRRHCELFEVGGQAHDPRPRQLQRDVRQRQASHRASRSLKHGDELTVGAVTLRVAKLGQPAPPLPAEPRFQAQGRRHRRRRGRSPVRRRDEEEFEMEFDDGEPEPEVEGHPPGRRRRRSRQAKPSPRPRAKNASSNDPTVTLEEAKKPAESREGARRTTRSPSSCSTSTSTTRNDRQPLDHAIASSQACSRPHRPMILIDRRDRPAAAASCRRTSAHAAASRSGRCFGRRPIRSSDSRSSPFPQK